ncbi:MAG: hypothetical protein GEU94_18525 [Micromonosporaceae bacterium]|nr:hypothetical protein [Micromonosporaceae bacterium]
MYPSEPQPGQPAGEPSYQPGPEPAGGYGPVPQPPQLGHGQPSAFASLRVRLSDALIGGGALLVFLFSFAPFISYDDRELVRRLEDENLPTWFSAWALETFLAPLTWWVIIAAIGMLALVGAGFTASRDRQLLGFRLGQAQLVLAYFAFVVLAGYALSAKTLVFGSELQDESFSDAPTGEMSFGWGGVFMLLGALAAAVAATFAYLDIDPVIWPLPGKAQLVGPPPQPGQPAWGYQPHSPHQPAPQHPGAAPQPTAAQPGVAPPSDATSQADQGEADGGHGSPPAPPQTTP